MLPKVRFRISFESLRGAGVEDQNATDCVRYDLCPTDRRLMSRNLPCGGRCRAVAYADTGPGCRQTVALRPPPRTGSLPPHRRRARYEWGEKVSSHSRFTKVESVKLSTDGTVAEVVLKVQPDNEWGLNRFRPSAWSVRLEVVFHLRSDETAPCDTRTCEGRGHRVDFETGNARQTAATSRGVRALYEAGRPLAGQPVLPLTATHR